MEVGARADLILLDANPLIDLNSLRALRGVMVRGRWLDKSSIDERLEMIAKSYAAK
jgi:imidazolonepropionase-like amidohydrolase